MMLKRLLRIPALYAMLLLLFVCILLAGSLRTDDGIPDCGIVCGNDVLARSLCEKLVADGFLPYETEADLRHAIRRGEVAMGMVLPDDFTDRLAHGKSSGLILFLESPTAVLQPLYRYRVAAYLMEVYAPYLTSDLLADAGVERTPAEMQAEMEKYLANKTDFAFAFTSIAGTPIEGEHSAEKMTAAALALLLFFALPLFAVPYTDRQFAALGGRVSKARAFKAYALPQLLLMPLLFIAVTVTALTLSELFFASGAAAYIVATVVYAVFLAALGILGTALVGDMARLRVPMIVLCLLSVGFCPIFADLPALLGIPAWPRFLLPPMFFYTAIEHPVFSAITAIALFAAALAGYYRRITKR